MPIPYFLLQSWGYVTPLALQYAKRQAAKLEELSKSFLPAVMGSDGLLHPCQAVMVGDTSLLPALGKGPCGSKAPRSAKSPNLFLCPMACRANGGCGHGCSPYWGEQSYMWHGMAWDKVLEAAREEGCHAGDRDEQHSALLTLHGPGWPSCTD